MSPNLDFLIRTLATNGLLKGAILVTFFYYAWFSFTAQSLERSILLITLISTPIIVLAARLLALNLPFRERPIHDENLDLTPITGISRRMLDGWPSFPSDHAVLYFSLAVGIIFVSGIRVLAGTLKFNSEANQLLDRSENL